MTKANAEVDRFQGIKVVSLEVGPEKTKYFVHKELLCQKSRYIEKAFNSGFRETTEQSIAMRKLGSS